MVVPTNSPFEPYEPIVINLEITNNAPFPLTMESGGPIRPQVVIYPTAQIAREPRIDAIKPMVVDINRRLRLEPHATLVVPVDLRRGALKETLDARPLQGATMKLRAILNFVVASSGAVGPGILGSEVEYAPIRVDGVRVNETWLNDAIAAILEPDSPGDLEKMALLSHAVARMVIAGPRAVPPPMRRLSADAATALTEAYPKLDPVSQAWLLTVLPRHAALEPLRDMARESEDSVVTIAYLTYAVRGLDDPVLVAAKDSEDPNVRRVAILMGDAVARALQDDQ